MKHFREIRTVSVLTIALLSALILTISPGFAATPEEIEDSIELGVPWLVSQQNPDGSWSGWGSTSSTGFAVLKLIDYVKEVPDIESWTDTDYIYHDEVVNGLNYLFSRAYYVGISLQPYGDPDTLDNDLGIRFVGFDDYETSIALMALGATMTPGLTVTVGPLTGVTYADVVQDVVDYLSSTQRESTWARGGWGYEGDPSWADNSVTGYTSLGLGYAQAFGATIPEFVKDELTHWIGLIQSPAGYSYYRPPAVWSDPYGDLLLRTGNLLYEMALVGMPLEDPSVQSALTYIENNWALPGGFYQRAYCLMKGLEAYGITDEISVGLSGDWFDELSTFIVSTQNPAGNWPNDPHDYYSPYVMSAAWALLTVEKAVAVPTDFVDIDVLPKRVENRISLGSSGTVNVAILSSESFDATTVDPLTVVFAGAGVTSSSRGKLLAIVVDVNGDGLDDLLVFFEISDLELVVGDTEAVLTGSLFDGTGFRGSDSVAVVP